MKTTVKRILDNMAINIHTANGLPNPEKDRWPKYGYRSAFATAKDPTPMPRSGLAGWSPDFGSTENYAPSAL